MEPPPPPSSSSKSRPRKKGRASTRARSSVSTHGHTAVVAELTDDLLVEILKRLPVKSLCRFKTVSRHWLRDLIEHPDWRKILPQTLAGFFFNSTNDNRFPRSAVHFVNASGRGRPKFDPSFRFLPEFYPLILDDCSNGLLLCTCYSAEEKGNYSMIVCNPATKQWAMLPNLDLNKAGEVACPPRLGFDPAASSQFHVFVLMEDAGRRLSGVYVYSSQSGEWIYSEKSGIDEDVVLLDPMAATVFHEGCLHFRALYGPHHGDRPSVAAVDTTGGNWSLFDAPCNEMHGLIQQIHGQLKYVSLNAHSEQYDNYDTDYHLDVWALEDYPNKIWTRKHSVGDDKKGEDDYYGNLFKPFGGETRVSFDWVSIHPNCDMFFFVRKPENTLACYSIDHQGFHEILTLGEGGGEPPYLPYVPLHSELESVQK